MNEAPLAVFQRAIESTHGSRAQLVAKERVHLIFEGQTVWQGEVLVFSLADHPSAVTCYAWETDGEVTAVRCTFCHRRTPRLRRLPSSSADSRSLRAVPSVRPPRPFVSYGPWDTFVERLAARS